MTTPSVPAFRLLPGWEKLPQGFHHRDVSGVAVDAHDRLFVITRGESRVIVYERDGTFAGAWGEGSFGERTHGIRVAPDGSLFCVDEGDHTVRQYTAEGRLLRTLGRPGRAAATGYDGSSLASITRGGEPFNRPTGVAIAAGGSLYVSDGYGNARVHRFSPDGGLVRSWGEPGTGPGEFHLPHAVWCTDDGRVLVADRENDRIQVFDTAGTFLEEWTDVQRPTDIFVDRDGRVFVSELPWRVGQVSLRRGPITEELPGRVSVLSLRGEVLTRLGVREGSTPESFWAPHTLCVDSRGDLYVGEVTWSFSGLGKAGLVPPGLPNLRKLLRVR